MNNYKYNYKTIGALAFMLRVYSKYEQHI